MVADARALLPRLNKIKIANSTVNQRYLKSFAIKEGVVVDATALSDFEKQCHTPMYEQ